MMTINPFAKYTCIYAHFNKQEKVQRYVVTFLKSLSQSGCRIIFVSNSSLNTSAMDFLISQVPGISVNVRENAGYDFGAWQWALEKDLVPKDSTHVIFANDSFIGPVHDLLPVLHTMHKQNADVWGLTETGNVDLYINI